MVPTSTIRNAIRSGVMIRMLINRADVVIRGDVAVAGGRQRDGRVVDAVQEGQRIVLNVVVAVAVEVDDEAPRRTAPRSRR